ncbi:MAG: hypothetical protein AAGH15_27915 [Myxococcota bacterium]
MPGAFRDADLRSLALHAAVAEKLDDALVEKAASRVRLWSAEGRPYAAAWRRLLSAPLEDLRNALVRDDEEMQALRSASPFAGALTPAERRAVIRSTRRSRA